MESVAVSSVASPGSSTSMLCESRTCSWVGFGTPFSGDSVFTCSSLVECTDALWRGVSGRVEVGVGIIRLDSSG